MLKEIYFCFHPKSVLHEQRAVFAEFQEKHFVQLGHEIIEMIRPHVSDISERTFFRRRKNAVEALSSILWGYTSRDSLSLMEQFFPDK